MLNVVLITLGVFLLLLIIFLYILPLKIAVDPENPLKWYYPCICSCMRNRQGQDGQVDDERNDNESEERAPLLVKVLT